MTPFTDEMASPGARARLAAFIGRRRDDILDAWQAAAGQLLQPALGDQIGGIVDRLAADLAEGSAPGVPLVDPDRFDLPQVVLELGLLRDAIVQLWERGDQLVELRMLHRVIDHAVATAVARYTRHAEAELAARHAEQRFLDEATHVLSSSLDYYETLDRIAKLAVPALADWCVVDLVEESALRRVAIVHIDPAKAEAAQDWARRYPPDATASNGVAQVIRTGEAELTPRITDDMLVAASRDPAQLAALRELGLRSAITAPLVARGRMLGAIRLVTAESRRTYEPRDLELAKELGRRAGLAVDNARLYQQAQHAVRVREDTLAIVSHDLRNPLGAIDLSASLLLQTQGGEPRTRKQLEIIRRATERMERLIRDLLDMASIQAGRLALERRSENAKQLVTEVADSFEPLAAEKSLTLVRDDQLGAVTILCDRTRITQVIGNLLSNAIKFCSSGDTITVGGRAVGDEARIEIADTGPGIAAADLPHIFEPYWSARRHAKKGTGLGLYICRGIVEAHGGRLWVETSEGHGTAFFVSLPLVR